MNDIFYNDDTKIKDLTVGQLKDIILEMIMSSNSSYRFTQSEGYFLPERKIGEPYCMRAESQIIE